MKDLTKDTILFSSKAEYINWLKDICEEYLRNWQKSAIQNNTIFACLENVVDFFGISADNAKVEDEFDFDNIKVEQENCFPKEFPCLFLTYSCNGLTYLGNKSQTVQYSDYPIFVYLSDFKENDSL